MKARRCVYAVSGVSHKPYGEVSLESSNIALAEGEVRDKVLIGKNGWLYLHSGEHRKFDFLSGKVQPSEESVTNFASNLVRRSSICDSIGAKYLHLPMPSKPLCAPEYLPSGYENIKSVFKRYYEPSLSDDLRSRIYYPINELQGSQYFRKFDTHMNENGNIRAAKLILGRLGINYDIDSEYRASTVNMGGDLATMMSMDLKAEEPYYEHLQNSLITIDNRNVLPSNTNHIRIVHNTLDRSGRTLLVSGDSFALWLLRFLALAFETVVYVRGPEFPYEILPLFQPSHVISSSTERYLAQQSADGHNTSAVLNCFYGSGARFDADFLSGMQALMARNYTPSKYRQWRGKLRAQILKGAGIGPGRATSGMEIVEHYPHPIYRAKSENDGFEFRNVKFQPNKKHRFRCTVNVDRPSTLALFFTTWAQGEQHFVDERSISANLEVGDNEIEIGLPDRPLARMIKVAPASAGTTFTIRDLTIFG